MTSSDNNDLGHAANSRANEYRRGRACNKRNWSGTNIIAMVLGFVFFWPVGLLVLFWILTGRNAVDLPAAIKAKWVAFRSGADIDLNLNVAASSDNIVFNEYQQTQHDKIREIKHEIAERSKRFNNWREDAQRRVDEQEFEAFMKGGY
ncbi:MAG: DUF2852 domain-containing protein [Granulosicoccaceae bacterium]